MAVSELSAVGAPSRELAAQLNSLFGPCALVSVMAVCVAIANCEIKKVRLGVYFFVCYGMAVRGRISVFSMGF